MNQRSSTELVDFKKVSSTLFYKFLYLDSRLLLLKISAGTFNFYLTGFWDPMRESFMLRGRGHYTLCLSNS